MARNVTATARQAVNASNTAQVFLVLLEVSHSTLATPLRFVNNTEDIISGGETFTAAGFSFAPPVEEDGTITNTSLTIDNVDRTIVELIRDLETPPTVKTYIILGDSPDTVEAGPWEFLLRNVTYNSLSVSGELVFQTFLQYNASMLKYNNNSFPGLYD